MADKLSACLIIKNEESCIATCLSGIKAYVDEIVVVDTGSTDRTVQIAKEYTGRIENHRWIDDFSTARNFSLSRASNDWVLILDADEAVEHWDVQAVHAFIAANDPHRAGRVEIRSVTDENGEERVISDHISRLFNKRYFQFSGTIHEQLVSRDGAAVKRTDVDITLLHSGYKSSEIKRKNKTARNISMLQKALQNQGDDCYLLYQLGKSYTLKNDHAAALQCFQKAVTLINGYRYEYVGDLIVAYGYALVNTADYKGAMALEKYREHYAANPDYTFLLAYIYMMNGMFARAAETFLQCTEQKGGKLVGVTAWLPLYNIGVIFECLGKRQEALAYYKACGNYEKAKARIAAILEK